jgi:hypothetical protein
VTRCDREAELVVGVSTDATMTKLTDPDELSRDEQSRVLELLVETVTVSKASVDIHFRANGIEQIVGELNPMSERADG